MRRQRAAQTGHFCLSGYFHPSETELYYLQSRYYDPTTCRFLNADIYVSTGQGPLGHNMFAYCNNNPINFFDPVGHSISDFLAEFINSVIEAIQQALITQYDVPLYDQGGLYICWAFCHVMVEDYQNSDKQTQKEATARAIELAKEQGIYDEYGKFTWDKGGWPTNLGAEFTVNNIFELYIALQNGPVYAYYWDGIFTNDPLSPSHLVVVTGVNLMTGTVYTNNPWGYSGGQSFNDFTKRVLHASGDTKENMPLYRLYYIN